MQNLQHVDCTDGAVLSALTDVHGTASDWPRVHVSMSRVLTRVFVNIRAVAFTELDVFEIAGIVKLKQRNKQERNGVRGEW